MLTGVALGWAWFHYRQRQAPPWLSRLLVVLLMLRFAIPLVTMGTELLFQNFLAADYAASQLRIDASSGEIAKLNPTVPSNSDSQGILQTMKAWVLQTSDLKQRLENLKASVERQIEHIIKISVIFLLQTTVIPFFAAVGYVQLHAKRARAAAADGQNVVFSCEAPGDFGLSKNRIRVLMRNPFYALAGNVIFLVTGFT